MGIDIGPYTIERGELLPRKDSYKSGQKKMVDGDGQVVVVEAPYDERFFTARMKGTKDEIEDVVAYLRATGRYSAAAITVVDGYGVSRSMRLWENSIEWRTVASNLIEVSLLLREEVT